MGPGIGLSGYAYVPPGPASMFSVHACGISGDAGLAGGMPGEYGGVRIAGDVGARRANPGIAHVPEPLEEAYSLSSISGSKGGKVGAKQFNQQRAAIGRGPAEAEFRAWLQNQGVVLAPKPNGSTGGPDAIRVGGTNLGWNFAELKPNNPQGIIDGTAQVYERFDQNYLGPGALYTWDGDGTPGKFIFRQAGLITPRLTLGL